MLELMKALTISQFEAALCALNVCIERCPEPSWNARVANLKFCQAALHALIYTDLYLSKSEDKEAFKRQPFHQQNAATFGDYEEFEDRAQVLCYDRPFIREYLQHCRRKAVEVVGAETADTLHGASGFSWRKCTRAELHIYNIRHIQHHAAQLSLRLRLDANVDIPWIGSGWREV